MWTLHDDHSLRVKEALTRRLTAFESAIPSRLRAGFAGNALKLGGGTAIGQALVALSAPAVTRLYAPSDVALVGLIVSFVTFASVALALRYDLAIVTAINDREADILLAAALVTTLAVAAVAIVMLAFFIRADLLSYGALPLWSISVVYCVLVLLGVATALRYWHVRRAGFGLISQSLILQGAGRASVSVGAGLLHPGWVGLLAGELAGRAIGLSRLLRTAWPSVRDAFSCSPAEIRRALSRNRKYPGVVLPSSLLDSAASVLPVPIVIFLFGRVDGGQFFLVQNLLGLPAVLIANSVADVLHARLSEAYLQDATQVASIMHHALVRLALLATCVYAPIALMAPFLARPLLGQAWRDAGMIAAVLSPLMATGLIVNPPSRVFVVVNRPEWKLAVDILRLSVPPLVLFACHTAGMAFLPSLIGYAAAGVCANGVFLLLVRHAGAAAPSLALLVADAVGAVDGVA